MHAYTVDVAAGCHGSCQAVVFDCSSAALRLYIM